MGPPNERSEPQKRIVLVVPVQHVKTVKTALERNGQLDRSSKITPETQEHGEIKIARQVSSKLDASESSSSQVQAKGAASSSTVPSGSAGTTQLPALQFDPELPSSPIDQPQLPNLHVDPEHSKPAGSTMFPRLQFDPITGEYKETSETELYPALELDASSGQYKKPSEQRHLEFDPANGEYRPASQDHGQNPGASVHEQRMRIPTTIPYKDTGHDEYEQELKATILENLGLSHSTQAISISHSALRDTTIPTSAKTPLHKALQAALTEIQPTLLMPLNLTIESLLSRFPNSYSIYPPMLLFPHNAFASPPWHTLLSTHPPESAALHPLWTHIASATNTTHMAINSAIPAQTSTPRPTQANNANILRSPLNIAPIYGDFGPKPTARTLSSPSPADFTSALWVTATQDRIHQTWAPLYTMFSRGNISEKARLLSLARSPAATATATAAAAADFYAGIGYFAFPYRKAGISTVLAWELNPWSVEGMRRGAVLNKWRARIVTGDEEPGFEVEEDADADADADKDKEEAADFLIFQMSNQTAPSIVASLKARNRLPGQITRVNLGLLPSSRLAWGAAVGVLEAGCEGWIHAHENVGVGEIEERRGEVERQFQRLAGERRVRVEHVERVKMYAPGVAHCVFDVRVW